MFKHSLMMIATNSVAVFGLSLLAAGVALGSDLDGCVDSPENPTWILAGIGGAAAGVPWLRAKIRTRREHRRNRRDK